MPETLYGGVQNRRVTIRDLQRATVLLGESGPAAAN